MNTKNNIISKHSRNINLDLLRVLAMFFIVLSHSLLHTGILDSLTPTHYNYYISYAVYGLIHVHVNCYVLLSGYFLSEKEFQFKKIKNLWAQAFFWSVIIFLFLNIFVIDFSNKELIKTLLPFTQQRYWFLTTYILMYLFSPFLNNAIKNMDEKIFRKSLLLIFIIYIILQNIFFFRNFTSMSGGSPLFFIFLYLTAAYLKKYPIKRKAPWFLLYITFSLITICSNFIISFIPQTLTHNILPKTLLYSYNSITVYLSSICLFEFFIHLKINKSTFLTKLVAFLSPLTFGIYLIHDHPNAREFIWNKLFPLKNISLSWHLIFCVIISSLIVFFISAILEYLRIKLFEIFKVKHN
ncbi:MAG: acyltransferase [Clostridia bacterium]|nr:acyltransferase [Clostridia bacterium]